MKTTLKVANALAAIGSACLLFSTCAASAGEVTIVEVLTNPTRTELLNKQIAEFETANPGTTVKLISLPYDDSFEKLLTMFKSGQIPDVVELADRWGGLYAGNGQLTPLDDYLAKSKELSTLQPQVLNIGKVGTTHVYTLPYGFLMRALYYNVDMLKAAGVEPPKTIDDVFTAARTVTEKLPGRFGYCLRAGKGGGYDWGFYPMQYGATGSFFDEKGTSNYATTGFQNGMAKYADLYRKGYAPKESISWGYGESVAGFTSEQCAILDQDNDALSAVTEKMEPAKFNVIPVPLGNTGKAFPSMGYFSWAIPAKSENKVEAWKLLSFLMAKKQNIEFDKTSFMLPAHVGANEDPFYAAKAWKAWFTMLENPGTYRTWTQPAYLPEWGVIYDKTMMEDGQAIMLGKKDVKDTANQWADVLNAAQMRYSAAK